MVSGMTQTEPRTAADIIASMDAVLRPDPDGPGFTARQHELSKLGLELAAAVRTDRQTMIDQRETARVEAILQVAKWALVEVIDQAGRANIEYVYLMAAIQWDDPALNEDADLR